MRGPVLLLTLLVASSALAGCFGGDKEAATSPTPTSSNTNPTPGGSTPSAPSLKVLAPLLTTLSSESPKWVASGTEVPMTATAPTAAKGAVTYTWATGPLPGTATVKAQTLDTKLFEGGKSASLTYTEPGSYLMHCHPHPFMKHTVFVVEGVPKRDLTVSITDGAKQDEYRFVPEVILIGPGSKVTYSNVGQQPHTATLEKQDPPLKKVPLATSTGAVKVEGDGWQRVHLIVADAEGRIGNATFSIYVTPTLPSFADTTVPFEFKAFTVPVPNAPTQPEPAKKASFKLDYPGMLTVNYSATDAATQNGGPADQNQASVEVHVTRQGDSQDAVTTEPGKSGSSTARVPAGTYEVSIVPIGGAGVKGEVVLSMVYDLVPPDPATPPAGGHAHHGGGGHAH